MKRLPEPPPVISLTWAQSAGWACCFCGRKLRSGAVSAGRAQGRAGAHDLSVEVYACPICAGTVKSVTD
ncbi:hypothetical protein PV755_00345 [Streptomyces caniscabiei]|uniref:hypothetical protein n=1 Tax=Streptomyces caniscabiei TaxID=2746961 RepID=UPI0029B5EC57|nr:hypothetical protein [Streptomyces caniscabiei]MDX3507384.1 hypothetical protein [Streptomyces caniscabiei]